MALGVTGQFSSHTRHGVSMAHGRQRPRSTNAVPMRTGPASANSPSPCFSSSVRGRIAAVGQTCPHATQLSWQPLVPMRKFSTGVHIPSRPVSNPAGMMMFVGQMRMHCPHLMHRWRKSASGRVPGGRMVRWE